MFYPTRAQMDPGSIWLRNIMLGIGREMERGSGRSRSTVAVVAANARNASPRRLRSVRVDS